MTTRQAEYDGQAVTLTMTETVANLVDYINTAKRGQFAFIKNHVSGEAGKSGCIVPGISDIWLLSLPRYDRYKVRLAAAIASVSADDVRRSGLSATDEDVTEARNVLLARLAGTDTNTEGQRAGQRNCYANIGQVRVHLYTAKSSTTQLMEPVTGNNGNMVADSVMLAFYEIRRYYHQHREDKPVNSRPDTILRNTIERLALKSQGMAHYKGLSLQKGNFSFLTLSSRKIAGMVRNIETAEVDAAMAEAYRDIGNLEAGPWSTLMAEADAATADAQEPVTVVDTDAEDDAAAPAPVR